MTTRSDLTPRELPWAGPPSENDGWSEPAGRRWEQRGYLWARRWRDLVTAPLVRPLARLGVAPWLVSLLGVAMAVALYWVLPRSAVGAAALFGGALLCDALDGALARYQGRASRRGKLLDLLCDSATFAALLLALLAAGAASPVRSAYAAYITLLLLFTAVCFHSIREARCSPALRPTRPSGSFVRGPGGEPVAQPLAPGATFSATGGGEARPSVAEGWALRPRGGFYAHLPKVPVYVAFLLGLLGGPVWVDHALVLTNVLATLFLVPFLIRVFGGGGAAETLQ